MLTHTNILVVQGPKGQLLIGPRTAFIGESHIEFLDAFQTVYSALRDAIDEQSEIDQLRLACDRWHIDDSRQTMMGSAALIDMVSEACAQRKLGAVLLDDKTLETPIAMRTFEQYRSDKRSSSAKSNSKAKDRSKEKIPADFTDRLLEVFDRMMDADAVGQKRADELKDILKGGMVDRLLALLTSREFLLSKRGVKFVMKLAGRSVFAVLSLSYAAYQHGKDIVRAVEEIVEAVKITNSASDSDDLDEAAKLMASGLSALGVKLIEVIVGEMAPRTRSLPAKNAMAKPKPDKPAVASSGASKQSAPKNSPETPPAKPKPDYKTRTSLASTPSSGVPIKADPDKTTTILGNYSKDMDQIINKDLGVPKNEDFGPKKGGFNVLNVPDEKFKNGDQFWEEYNKPFLQSAIDRGDNIALATKPDKSLMTKVENNKIVPTGFGREMEFLKQNGYEYDPVASVMKKVR